MRTRAGLVLLLLVTVLGGALRLAPAGLQLGPQQQVRTRQPLAGVHTRFTDEVEAWKIQRGLTMVRDMGATWVVEFFPWAYAESAPGQYDWRSFDALIDRANRQGLRVIARLGFVPLWARVRAAGGEREAAQTTVTWLPPALYVDFARYATAFAARYRGRVAAVQIWNEPNLSLEWGMRPVDPEGYAAMLGVVYDAIKRAAPETIVLAGALAPTLEPAGSANGMDDLVFLERVYAALGEARPWDALAVHAYGLTQQPSAPPAAEAVNFRRVELLRAVMLRHGDTRDVHITEAGWNDAPRWPQAVTPAQRIEYTLGAWAYAGANWPWVRSVSMWVFKLPAPAGGYRDAWTFVTPDLEPLPIYAELRAALVPPP